MSQERVSVRADIVRVVRVVSRYVATEYEIGSVAGRWVIHETRLPRKNRVVDIDIETASAEEILDAIRIAEIRRAVYAAPAPRTDVVYSDGPDKGRPMRAVAPRQCLAQPVRVKVSRGSGSGGDDVRSWRLTVAIYLGKLPQASQVALLGVAKQSFAHVEIRNQLQAARSDAGRLRGGSKRITQLRSRADQVVRALAEKERSSSESIGSAVRSRAYRFGLIELSRIFAQTPDIESYVFGDEL